MDHLLPLSCMQEQVLHLETGQELDLEAWKIRLAELGYERMPQVDGMGQFSVRGGILDIYPLTEGFRCVSSCGTPRWIPSAPST